MKCLLLRDPIFVVAHELLVILPFSKESHIFQVARLLWCVLSHGTPHLLKTWQFSSLEMLLTFSGKFYAFFCGYSVPQTQPVTP